MNEVFRPYLRKFVLIFFCGIVIYNKGWKNRLAHIKTILRVLLNHSFVLNQKKCQFALTQIEYLGHVISSQGVSGNYRKIKCVKLWPQPKNTKGLRGFLGLTGYYRKFVKDYGNMAKPLTDQLKKNNFCLSESTSNI